MQHQALHLAKAQTRVSVPVCATPSCRYLQIAATGRAGVAQTLLSVLVKLGTAGKINGGFAALAVG
jgi:hypothetical protein